MIWTLNANNPPSNFFPTQNFNDVKEMNNISICTKGGTSYEYDVHFGKPINNPVDSTLFSFLKDSVCLTQESKTVCVSVTELKEKLGLRLVSEPIIIGKTQQIKSCLLSGGTQIFCDTFDFSPAHTKLKYYHSSGFTVDFETGLKTVFDTTWANNGTRWVLDTVVQTNSCYQYYKTVADSSDCRVTLTNLVLNCLDTISKTALISWQICDTTANQPNIVRKRTTDYNQSSKFLVSTDSVFSNNIFSHVEKDSTCIYTKSPRKIQLDSFNLLNLADLVDCEDNVVQTDTLSLECFKNCN